MIPTLLVICTKDRPRELAECLEVLATAEPNLPVLVIDAGRDSAAADVCDRAAVSFGAGLERIVAVPHLSRQRNLAVAAARSRGAEILAFVDDDVLVEPGAISALVAALESDAALAATGAVVLDEPPARGIVVKAFFCLWSRRPGAVLPSGRNVIGHYVDGPWPRRVDWLSTCAIAMRLSHLGDLTFDERLTGYSYGEDLDLTFRLSRQHPLSVTPEAQVRHLRSARGRPTGRSLAWRKTQLLHAWVTELRWAGLRRRWFWWSVVGEVLLLSGKAVSTRGARLELAGVVTGAVEVLRHGSRRDVGEIARASRLQPP